MKYTYPRLTPQQKAQVLGDKLGEVSKHQRKTSAMKVNTPKLTPGQKARILGEQPVAAPKPVEHLVTFFSLDPRIRFDAIYLANSTEHAIDQAFLSIRSGHDWLCVKALPVPIGCDLTDPKDRRTLERIRKTAIKPMAKTLARWRRQLTKYGSCAV